MNFRKIASSVVDVFSGSKKPAPNQPLIDSVDQSYETISQAYLLPVEFRTQMRDVIAGFNQWMIENFEQIQLEQDQKRAKTLAPMWELLPKLNEAFADSNLWGDSIKTTSGKIIAQVKERRSYKMAVGELAYSVERYVEKSMAVKDGLIKFLEIMREVVPEEHALNTKAQNLLAQLYEHTAELPNRARPVATPNALSL